MNLRPALLCRFAIALVLFGSVLAQSASAQQCAQPLSSGAAPVASDCLFILGAAVGLKTCTPACICAPTGALPAKATDALLCLRRATGQQVTLDCPCDSEPPSEGDPIGFASADRAKAIVPGFFPGLPATITDEFNLGAAFSKVTANGTTPDVTETVETVGGCTVTTTESHFVYDPGDPLPTVVNYDPGNPGHADNGPTQLDLIRESAQGFETFAPLEDPLDEGFDGGQDIEFSWPGGDDIDAFSGSIGVPPNVVITSPDLTSASFDVTAGNSVSLEWVPGTDDDGKLAVELSSSITEITDGQGGSSTIHTESVSIVCLFNDAAGAGTVPGSATSRLQAPVSLPKLFAKSITAKRENTKSIAVTTPGAGSGRAVMLIGTNSVTRSLVAIILPPF